MKPTTTYTLPNGRKLYLMQHSNARSTIAILYTRKDAPFASTVGYIQRQDTSRGQWTYSAVNGQQAGKSKDWTRKEAAMAAYDAHNRRKAAKRKREKEPRCTCRKPKIHRDCAYCGWTVHSDGKVCGVCHEAGIDGSVIRGTERRVCKLHKS